MKKLKLTLYFFVILSLFVAYLPVPNAKASFQKSNLIADSIMDNKNSMTAASIDAFLNKFPHSCISSKGGFAAKMPTGYNPTNGFTYGAYVSAGNVIYAAAQAYDINPRMLIVTLEKEQSLVTGRYDFSGYCMASNHKYASAMGYGCPDSGGTYSYNGLSLYRRNGVEIKKVASTCVNSSTKAGFTQQVIRGAWLLKFGQQRSKGNVSWAIIRGSWNNSDDPDTYYSGPMTRGTLKRCSSCSAVFYDGYQTIDSQSVLMGTGGTAALYWYTPHFHGNQLFVNLYEQYFGPTNYGPCYNGVNVSSTDSGRDILPTPGGLSYTRMNNTGSKCVEIHTWKPGFKSWQSNVATHLVAQDPGNKEIINADTNGDGKGEMILVKYSSGSGKVELHFWDSTLYRWVANTATNLTNRNPANGQIIAADTNGDGRDELHYLKYNNTGSGKVEIHTWARGFKSWSSNRATNLNDFSLSRGRIISADILKGSQDEFIYVKYNTTGSGNIELHVWEPGYKKWMAQYVTNTPDTGTISREVVASNIYGSAKDEISFVRIDNTSSGNVEVHTWKPGFKSWLAHVVTNMPEFDPSL